MSPPLASVIYNCRSPVTVTTADGSAVFNARANSSVNGRGASTSARAIPHNATTQMSNASKALMRHAPKLHHDVLSNAWLSRTYQEPQIKHGAPWFGGAKRFERTFGFRPEG